MTGDLERTMDEVAARVRPTAFLTRPRLDARTGASLVLVSEIGQHTGSFKARAATAAVAGSQATHLLTASSGNFGAALAWAAQAEGKRATVVMPARAARCKIEAVRGYGGEVDLVDTEKQSRLARLAELARAEPAAEVLSPYDDPRVVAGNASLGRELFTRETVDVVVVPVGGGGLASGVVLARDRFAPGARVVGAEPLLANDAARSLRAGFLCVNEREPDTLCDGARTLSLGRLNFDLLARGLEDIVEVEEAMVKGALQLLAAEGVRAEPTGALALAAVLCAGERFAGRRVACVVSGGNVDDVLYERIAR
jgi:threonine dehydratase